MHASVRLIILHTTRAAKRPLFKPESLVAMNAQVAPVFAHGGPFYDMVMSFLAATVGLGPVFDPNNPLALSPQIIAVYTGRVAGAGLDIDTGQIHRECISGRLPVNTAVNSLCGMLLNTAWESLGRHGHRGADFEFFRLVRHAVSHGNKFNFYKIEPRLPTAWRALTIDHNRKGKTNPLYGTQCVGVTLMPADAIWLLHDIEQQLR
jgi:hypothetical protein